MCPLVVNFYPQQRERLNPHIRILANRLARRPRKTFTYFPLIPRLLLQYANPQRTTEFASYSHAKYGIDPHGGNGEPVLYSDREILTGFWSGREKEGNEKKNNTKTKRLGSQYEYWKNIAAAS